MEVVRLHRVRTCMVASNSCADDGQNVYVASKSHQLVTVHSDELYALESLLERLLSFATPLIRCKTIRNWRHREERRNKNPASTYLQFGVR
jgi:hypothetical protein